MPQLFRPRECLFPAPLEPSPPLGPAWMPSPPPLPVPPLAAEDEERPWPPMKKKMRLLFPYAAVNRVFGIMDRVWPWPPMKKKMRLLFPYAAVNRVFGIMDRVWGMAMIGLHIGICIVNIIANLLSFYIDGDQGGLWTLVSRVTQFLCYVFTTCIMCALISYYMRVDGEYHAFEPSPRHLQPAPAAAEELPQLPPPPPEMDMC